MIHKNPCLQKKKKIIFVVKKDKNEIPQDC